MEAFIQYSTLLIVLMSVVVATGIVLRVEKRLDVSFKFFQAAAIIFAIILIFEIISATFHLPNYTPIRLYLRMLFSICFLFGLWEMRTIVRELDGELQKEKERKRKLSSRR